MRILVATDAWPPQVNGVVRSLQSLAANARKLGVNTDTGIAGLTLGGGYGWLAGKFGLACDNLLSADVVTADGRLLVASYTEN